tara:strand:- start:367 stop:2157 length:1791 start_codon:yes stop_codon:yes gene_type:complete
VCGLFGFWLNRPLSDDDIKSADKYLLNLNHRGPDNQESWFNKEIGIYLGHTRLSIIGLDVKNNQPLVTDKSTIIYNGELYNFNNIKNKLIEKGYTFKTDTDTEVVQIAWQHWGKSCFDLFDGMFAFAIFDNKNLYLVNDFFGEKPIYYLNNKEGFFFASEIDILVKFTKAQINMSKTDDTDFLALGFLNFPNTGFEGIKYLEPASIISINEDKKIDIKKYWELEKINPKDLKKNLEKSDLKKIQNLLIESLENRLFADVNLGLFLSSGIDSTLVATLLSKELNTNINAYTVGFPQGVDESLKAKEIADYLKINHTIINSDDDLKSKNLIDLLFDLYGELNDNLTGLSIFQISKESKKNITVALSGIGGDELFYGYNKYSFLFKNRFYYNLNRNIYSSVLSFIANLKIAKKIENIDAYLNCNENLRFIALKDLQTKKLLSKFKLKNSSLNFIHNQSSFLEKVRNYDLLNTLPNSYLKSVDRGSMKSSLEIRTPYLNKKIFEFINTFEHNVFLLKENKFIQKEILRKYIPENLISTNKKGFVVPYKNYFKDHPFKINSLPVHLTELSKYVKENKNSIDYDKISFRISVLNSFYEKYKD